MTTSTLKRCFWVSGKESKNQKMIDYHDKEWGKPVHNDKELFEFLILEGAQAGLNWSTVLNKRENYRKAFANWDIQKISKFTDKDFEKCMSNEGLIRNKLKIRSTINNAKASLKVIDEFGSLDKYLWSFVNYKTIHNKIKDISDCPTKTDISEKMSKELKKRGFNFVGPTIMYAFMQAVGMVNDHSIDCSFRNATEEKKKIEKKRKNKDSSEKTNKKSKK